MVKRPDLFDPAITAASRIAIDHADGGKETRKSLAAYLRKVVPQLYDHAEAEAMTDAVWKFTDELSSLIKRKQNSIWAFIVATATGRDVARPL